MRLENREQVNHEQELDAFVVYGTRWGGTAEVARQIGKTLESEGYNVEVVDAKNKPIISDHVQLVVVGSGISAGSWTKESLEFLNKNDTLLREIQLALFVSCGSVEKENFEERMKDMENLLPDVARRYGLSPVEYGFFGGVVDYNRRYNLFDSLIVAMSKGKVRKMGIDTSKPYDFRDWNQITEWSRKVAKTKDKSVPSIIIS